MPLPADDTSWPPPQAQDRYARFPKLSAWYSGDPDKLASAYTGSAVSQTVGQDGIVRRVANAIRATFWGTTLSAEVSTKRHLPVAQDIATLSADLLFSDPPTVRVLGPMVEQTNAEGKTEKVPGPETVAAQARLDWLLDRNGFHNLLLAGAEVGAALGSTGLRIAWDKTQLRDRPLLTRADADAMIPLYSWGQLVGVIFWQVVSSGNGAVWRHLELHEGGKVYHGLYKGDGTNLGKRQPLGMMPRFAGLAQLVDDEGAITVLADGGKTATSVANVLPDPLDRLSYAGRSDYTPGVLDLFDAIDKAYSQMMETVDDAKSRLLIADSMLEKQGPGGGVSFDLNQRIFQRVKVPPAEKEGGGLPIEKVQFDMHIEEYISLIEFLASKAVYEAGYTSPKSQDEAGAPMTATEWAGRNRRSMVTRDKKVRYWQTEMEELLGSFLRIDVQEFTPRYDPALPGQWATGQPVKAYPVEVKFPEAVQPTQIELAATAKALKDAGESIYEIQRVLHPDWSETELETNIARIQAAASVIDPVSFGTGGFGVGPGDGL